MNIKEFKKKYHWDKGGNFQFEVYQPLDDEDDIKIEYTSNWDGYDGNRENYEVARISPNGELKYFNNKRDLPDLYQDIMDLVKYIQQQTLLKRYLVILYENEGTYFVLTKDNKVKTVSFNQFKNEDFEDDTLFTEEEKLNQLNKPYKYPKPELVKGFKAERGDK